MTGEPELRDLPSLDAWGEELRDAVQRAEAPSGRRRLPMRRIVPAVALMLLAVPGAVATRSIWVDPIDRFDPIRDPDSTPAVRLAEGRSGSVRWRLGGFVRTDGRHCVQLQTSLRNPDTAAGCTHPLDDTIIDLGMTGDDDVRFVYGTVSPKVETVSVTVGGGRELRVATGAPDPEALRRSRMPDIRTFVASFAGGFDEIRAPLVIAYDVEGHEIARIGGGRR